MKDDSNEDGRLTETDQKAIAPSEVSGRNYTENYTELLPSVDRILGMVQIAPTRVMLVHTSDNQNFVTEVDVVNRQVISTQKLAAFE
ncbi:hypothetical protein [Leptothermofonsia sp. ETS-13]|uniref:hypothetical protein n=1 Tax=Leptothermofonsia sp. ETS-13 TaxID=3035696 RepID=UPI003B9F2733